MKTDIEGFESNKGNEWIDELLLIDFSIIFYYILIFILNLTNLIFLFNPILKQNHSGKVMKYLTTILYIIILINKMLMVEMNDSL